MDLVLASRAPVELMGRPRRSESERVSTIGASRTIPRLNPMHREAARATFRSRSFIAVGRRLHRGGADCRLRLRQLGIGAISDHLLGPFDPMKGRACQRGSFRVQTHDMVYRMASANRLHRPTIADGPMAGQDGQNAEGISWRSLALLGTTLRWRSLVTLSVRRH